MAPPAALCLKLILFAAAVVGAAQDAPPPVGGPQAQVATDELEAAGSSVVTHQALPPATSHRVLASGWPSTSPMWPSIESADQHPPGNSSATASSHWLERMEPFIYADTPRSVDYSLLLKINQTLLELLKGHLKPPMQMSLSFEYYFNYDARRVSALPGIKIEVDRKQFRYIEPAAAAAGGDVRSRLWIRFNDSILITDHSFDSADWLKFSLVNRQAPSLVAIRRLKAHFQLASGNSTTSGPSSTDTSGGGSSQTTTPSSSVPAASTPAPTVKPPTQTSTTGAPPPPPQATPTTPPPASLPPVRVGETGQEAVPAVPAAAPGDEGSEPAASNLSPSTIKPPGLGWNIWNKIGGRKKREAAPEVAAAAAPDSVELTCFQSDRCDWAPGQGDEKIQWSLARMPPATEAVQSGYYYVSNHLDYGNHSSLLQVHLNQTDSATLADQNADHCLELALYVTERSLLRLYHMRRKSVSDQWELGHHLLSWSATLSTSNRPFLPPSRLSSMESGQHGWTYETLCFGHFFSQHKDCSEGLCAFGFQMVPGASHASSLLPSDGGGAAVSSPATESEPAEELQVAGVGLLREFALNIPQDPQQQPPLRWLESWQRPEVEPSRNWRFYPRQEYRAGADNISLESLHDGALFYMESDWLRVEPHLSFSAILVLESNNDHLNLTYPPGLLDTSPEEQLQVFTLHSDIRLVDAHFGLITNFSSAFHWSLNDNSTLYNLTLPVSEQLANHQQPNAPPDSGLFKLVLELALDAHLLQPGSVLEYLIRNNQLAYRISLANVSLSDRCFPNPCLFGQCQQNGTNLDEWSCHCDERHRGRRCEFGRWCNLAHVTPWVGPSHGDSSGGAGGKLSTPPVTLKISSQSARQPKLGPESVTRVTGRDYCQRKLGPGFKCIDLDVPLNDNLYFEEERTFSCTCQDDYYLSDDSRCRQAHQCNSVLCPAPGQICDESRPFNRSQPCRCNEKQDWFEEPQQESGAGSRCQRRQCQDRERDCGFAAHLCLPTLPGERPICKCSAGFVLRPDPERPGRQHCQSAACWLPTLNDCQQLCQPDNSNLQRPYTCACHPGYRLAADERSCVPQRPHLAPHCKPGCHEESQVCTDLGCRCKQGFVGEGELRIQLPKSKAASTTTTTNATFLTQPARCLNVCELTYAENKEEFERIEAVCPLGLCDKSSFQCRCSDPSSSALIHSKYEPIFEVPATNSSDSPLVAPSDRKRNSPLCHLRRVCEPDSSSYKLCRSQGAICVPDYTKAAMFDCVCPPATNKRLFGSETSTEFTCEPKCASKRNDCLRRQSVCRLVDQDEVRCECLPGLMFDAHEQRCYLAKYSYSFNLLVVNRYYDPEFKFHQQEPPGNVTAAASHQTTSAAPFLAEFNQCNISQVLPRALIDDSYEHDMDTFLGYMDQCNQKLHQTVRTYHLNSRLAEDVRQSLRQHLRDFTVITSNSSCSETDYTGAYLNCTVYLQSQEPVSGATIDYVMNNCDQNGFSDHFCWIKPRLLLRRPEVNETQTADAGRLNYKQIVPCELDNFCGPDAYSVRLDDKSSLCSCRCPQDIEIVDLKDLEPRKQADDLTRVAVKEICAPRNHCGLNSSYCASKVGSVCLYDVRLGSRCDCVYPAYEDSLGHCVEVTFTQLDNTLIVLLILLGTALVVSILVNLYLVGKSRSLFGGSRSKQYPLSEFSAPPSRAAAAAGMGRSTGVPNPVFDDND